MARKNIDFESPAKKTSPKKPAKRKFLDSPLKRVKKDLFGAKRSRLNNMKSPLFYSKTLNTKNYKLTGSKKWLQELDPEIYVSKGLYSKKMQDREMKKPIVNQGISPSEMAMWGSLAKHYYIDAAAKAEATHKAKAI